MIPSGDVTRFLEGLAACGWFDALPPQAAQAARDGVAKAFVDGKNMWVGLVCATPDSAYLLEDQPYTALLRQFAAASHGAFQPESIREEPEAGAVRFAFRAAGRDYVRSLPADAFDVPDSFFEAINEAMKASGTPLRFLQIHDLGWGPIPGFTLTTPQALRKAAAAKLVATEEPSDELTEEELEGFAATLDSALRGSETFYWTLDGMTVAEARVPSGFELDTSEASAGGSGETILAYEGTGTLMFHCGPPRGEPFSMGKGFKLAESLARDDRLTQRGATKMSGAEMAWRQDAFQGMPVHVVYLVRKEVEKTFAEALDSVRIFEPTPEMTALFESRLAPAPAKKKEKKEKKAARKRR